MVSMASWLAVLMLGTPARGARLSASQRISDNSARSFDAGDSYATPQGRRVLHRVAGSCVIRFADGSQSATLSRQLIATNAAWAGHEIDFEPGAQFVVLRESATGKRSSARASSRDQQLLTTVRRTAGVAAANPLFVDPATGLWLIARSEIIVCLQPGVTPEAYFGADWARVRRMAGTTNQFLFSTATTTAEEILAEVDRRANDPRVAWAEPDWLGQIVRQGNDPLFSLQWHLSNTGLNGSTAGADAKAAGAWNITAGSSNIVIALLDDGLDMAHPDLAPSLWSNPGELPNGLDDDHNGYIDDVHGWDFVANNADPGPKDINDDHGTATSGIAAAAANNGLGGSGMAPRCQLIMLKVLTGDAGTTSGIAEALRYAAGGTRSGVGSWRGADVISMSLTMNQSATVDSAIVWATTQGRAGKGCPFFCAAGNEASRWLTYRYRLAVGADLGPGTYRFGFDYSKDAAGDILDEDLIKIDNVALLGADGVTVLNSPLGSGGRQDFEGTFPPTGWKFDTSGTGVNNWVVTTANPLRGTGGARSAQAGGIADGTWTELQTPLVTLTGNETLAFSCYVSSELDYDGLSVWIYDSTNGIVTSYGDLDYPLLSGSDPVSTAVSYPASHSNTIAVGAATDFDLRADYSCYGTALDLLAPSSGGWNDTVSTDRVGTNGYNDAGDYCYDFGGTSSATPLAAGAGALVLSINPALTAAEVRSILRASCDKVGGVTYDASGWNQYFGYGRINAVKAVDKAFLRVTAARPSGTNFLIRFNTLATRNYRVERTDKVAPTNWTGLTGATNVTGTGAVLPVTDTGAVTNPARLYRVRQLP